MSRTRTIGRWLLALSAAACAAGPPPLPAGAAIGEPITPRAPLLLETVLAQPDSYLDRTLLVEATVANVCRTKG